VQVLAGGRTVSGTEVTAQHVRERHAHLVTGAGVADHRADAVALLEGVHAADGDRLLARAEPRLRDHALSNPALERDVVQPEPNEAAIQTE